METLPLLKDRRMLLLSAIVLLSFILVYFLGFHLGIEFEGGTRLPVTLEKPVTPDIMDEISNTIKARATGYGLKQVRVKPVGETEIYIEVSRADTSLIAEIEGILKKQGKFEGIVDGRVAITSDDMVPGSVGEGMLREVGGAIQWSITFAITSDAAKKFAKVVYGKANYPVYMFLDRPENAIILLKRSELMENLTAGITTTEALSVLYRALTKDNDTLPIYLIDDWESTKEKLANRTEKSVIISDDALSPKIRADLEQMNFTIINKSHEDIVPIFSLSEGELSVDTWKGVGLLSSPRLSPQITHGEINQLYQISGYAKGYTWEERNANAKYEIRYLKSILSGGALPVHVIVGSTTTVPAPLGSEFLKYSIIGIFVALMAVALIVATRYTTMKIILPILGTCIIEMVILICFVGAVGTMDLSAMAGIISSVGTSVDDQIVITDEMLRSPSTRLSKEKEKRMSIRKKLDSAFDIVFRRVTVAIIALLPLLFSGLVEITSFALATVIGNMLGVLVTRPAYGAVIEYMFKKEED
ncbi:MAG: hypothetical protein QXP42_05270 [Candidatus Micrarchaeia archaeon]